ncbi:MAG TPA: hypothetical protein VGP41_15305 [Candidatus Lustribacter sp.]|nr:hypothetical protein [Candidatus Lustribacter sp.]
MNRAEFVAAVASATAAPVVRPAREAPIVAEVTLQRDASDLLSPFVVAIALNNTTGNVVRLDFPTADLFRIDVIRDDSPVWSSLTQHKPIPVNRQLDVPPGRTKLASMTIDGTTDDRRSYAPGKYIVRVAMLGTSFGMVVDKPIDFPPPLTVAEALRIKPGTVMTIAGDQISFGGGVFLRDATGSVHLSRSLGLRPTGTYVVRGFLDASGDDRIFDVGRFAPAFDNPPTPPQ